MNPKVLAITFFVSLPAGATPPADPWALVPPLPSACYDEQDGYMAKVAAATATLDEEILAQDAINNSANEQLATMSEADPFEMAQRMQEYMMNNPEGATKMMEDLYSTGQTYYEDFTADAERERALKVPLDDLVARYRAEFAEIRAARDAKLAALPTDEDAAEFYWTKEALAQLPAINQQTDAAYAKVCAEWWQDQPFAAPLAEFRTFLANEHVPAQDESFRRNKQQWDIQGVDTSEFQSTAAMAATRNYLQQLQLIYQERAEHRTDLHVQP